MAKKKSPEFKKLTANQAKKLQAPGQFKPQWVVGFVDGDGCFSVVTPSEGGKRCCFVVSQHRRSGYVLYQFKEFFGCGNVHDTNNNMMEYRVETPNELITIIFPFFQKYPLQSCKIFDLQKISDALYLKLNIANPFIFTNQNSDLYKHKDWLAGLVDSDGCFSFAMGSPKQVKAQPQLVIVLALREEKMLVALAAHFKMGKVYFRKTGYVVFQISKQDCHEIIISILTKRLKTTKRFSLWYFTACLKCWRDYVVKAARFKRLYKSKDVVVSRIKKFKKRMNTFPVKKKKLDTAGLEVEVKVQN